jgi:transcriptional regulator GlxA family with amidase domain
MCFAAFSVFEVANSKLGKAAYELLVLSESGGTVRTSFGMEVQTQPLTHGGIDTVLVGVDMQIPAISESMAAYLRQAAKSVRRLASICLGAFALGEAGLLDGRRATTHWRFSHELQRRYPQCKVDVDRIFIGDGNIWTSAGMSAGTDLAVGLVESDYGTGLAHEVARGMVMHHRRAGGQSQHSALLELGARADRIQTALAYAKRNLHMPLGIEDLARAANLSPRQFTRVFRSDTGMSPAKAIETLRLEAAKLMLEQSRLPIEIVARETGFGDGERMRRAFVRAYGMPPRAMRKNA